MPPVWPTARAVIHSSTFQMVVIPAAGVYKPATVVALAMVPGVGSTPSAKMNVAAAVLAMFPHACATRWTPALAFALATAGTPHSAPPGGNSSHIEPDVCGSEYPARKVPMIGAVDHAVAICPIDAGAEKSLDPPDARPVPVFVADGRASVNAMSLPATAPVCSTFTRTPTSHSRFAAVPYSDRSAVEEVAARVMVPRAE